MNRLKGANLFVEVTTNNIAPAPVNKRPAAIEPESPAFDFDFMATGRSKLKNLPKIKEESMQQDDGRTLSVIKESKLSNQGGPSSVENGESITRFVAPSTKNFGIVEPVITKSRNESVYPQDTVFEVMSRKGQQTHVSKNEGILAQSIDKQIKLAGRRKSTNFKNVQEFLTLGQQDDSGTPEGIKTPPLKKIISEVVEVNQAKKRGEFGPRRDYERAHTNPTVGANLMEESAVIAKFEDRFEKIGNNTTKPKEVTFVPAGINESEPPAFQFAVVQRKFSNDSLDQADPHNIQTQKAQMKRSMTMGGDPRRNSRSVQDLGHLERKNDGPFIIPIRPQQVTVSDSKEPSDSNLNETKELLAEFQKEKKAMEQKIQALERKLLAITKKQVKSSQGPPKPVQQLQSDFEAITEEDSQSWTRHKASGGELGPMHASKHPGKSHSSHVQAARLQASGKSGSRTGVPSKSVSTQTTEHSGRVTRGTDAFLLRDRKVGRYVPEPVGHCSNCCPHPRPQRTETGPPERQTRKQAETWLKNCAYARRVVVRTRRTPGPVVLRTEHTPGYVRDQSANTRSRTDSRQLGFVTPTSDYEDATHLFGLSLALM